MEVQVKVRLKYCVPEKLVAFLEKFSTAFIFIFLGGLLWDWLGIGESRLFLDNWGPWLVGFFVLNTMERVLTRIWMLETLLEELVSYEDLEVLLRKRSKAAHNALEEEREALQMESTDAQKWCSWTARATKKEFWRIYSIIKKLTCMEMKPKIGDYNY